MRRRILLTAIAIALVNWTQAGTMRVSAQRVEPALSFEDEVREAVFRYLFKTQDPDARAQAYFVGIVEGEKQRDPSPALMKRFAGNRPRVMRASAAKVGVMGAVQPGTGDSGIAFHVGAITKVNEDVLEVEAGHYAGNLAASGGTYRVERKDGAWAVTRFLRGWVA